MHTVTETLISPIYSSALDINHIALIIFPLSRGNPKKDEFETTLLRLNLKPWREKIEERT